MKISTFNELGIYCYLLGQQISLYPEKEQVKYESKLQPAILNQLLPVTGVAL